MQGCRVHEETRFVSSIGFVVRDFFFYVKPDHELSLSVVSMKKVGVPVEQYSKNEIFVSRYTHCIHNLVF